MNMDKGNLQGSGCADMSGDVESKPESGSKNSPKSDFSKTMAPARELQGNKDVQPSSYNDMNESNGMSVIMPKE